MDYYIFMNEAIKEAKKAADHGDVPVGAVAVYEGQIIGRGHNRKEINNDPVSHGETEAIREAAGRLNTWRLSGVTLFVTMEPCPMCAGAILQSRIDTLVFGAWDANWGACGSTVNLMKPGLYNHNTEIIGGIMEKECAALTEAFFHSLRKDRF
jgi:tRNA(adenine34) deaminase